MDWRNDCAVIIPCFNEAATIGALVADVRRLLPAVIVIDDGSLDDTARLAEAAGAQLLRHPSNLGKGAALATGLRYAFERGFRWALTMDGDGQHAPGDMSSFVQAAERSTPAMVVGNRMRNPAPMPWVRRVVNRWMSRRLSRRAHRELPDSQCGFRLIYLPAWAELELHTRHFEVESEMLLAFVAAGLRVEFVPIQVIYASGHSKINPLLDTCRWLWWWWRSRGVCRAARPGSAPSLAGSEAEARARVQARG